MSRAPARLLVALSLLLACAPKSGPDSSPPGEPVPPDQPLPPTPPTEPLPPAEPDPPAEPEPPDQPVPVSLRVSGPGPLTEAQRQVLHGSPEDEVPAKRDGILGMHEDEHYITSNERTLDLFHPVIADVGGGYMGVGTDQGYLLVEWADSDIAWLVDYDPEVMLVHALYRRFLLGVDTPEQFLALWERDGREAAEALLHADTEPAEARRLVGTYQTYRAEIVRRLHKVEKRMRRVKLGCYLTDPDRYAHLQQMLREGRIRPMLANLLDDRAVAGIAQSARTLEVPIRVLYLSNAEQYWRRYAPQYRSNIAALPRHEDAVVLRTLLRGSVDKDFHYGVQPLGNYVEWLEAPYIRRVYDITGRPEAERGTLSFFRTQGDPERTSLARRWEKAQARRDPAPDAAEPSESSGSAGPAGPEP